MPIKAIESNGHNCLNKHKISRDFLLSQIAGFIKDFEQARNPTYMYDFLIYLILNTWN